MRDTWVMVPSSHKGNAINSINIVANTHAYKAKGPAILALIKGLNNQLEPIMPPADNNNKFALEIALSSIPDLESILSSSNYIAKKSIKCLRHPKKIKNTKETKNIQL